MYSLFNVKYCASFTKLAHLILELSFVENPLNACFAGSNSKVFLYIQFEVNLNGQPFLRLNPYLAAPIIVASINPAGNTYAAFASYEGFIDVLQINNVPIFSDVASPK